MTVGEQLINDLMYWKEQKAIAMKKLKEIADAGGEPSINDLTLWQDAIQKLKEIEDSLVDMDSMYEGKYVSILEFYGDMDGACLYVEDVDGDSGHINVSLEELLEIF